MSIRGSNSFRNKNSKDTNNFSNIKKLLKEKNLNPKKTKDLKYLLSLTINPDLKKFSNSINFDCLLLFLFNYLSPNTLYLFTELFFHSCELGSLSIIKILLEKNLDVNSRNELGETPLHIAIAKKDVELIKLLTEYNPKTNIGTYRDGLTAVNYAEIYGDKNIIKMIIALNEKNKKEEIQNEIKDCINNDLDNILINDNALNLEQIQDFNGEKITIITDSEVNSSNFNNYLNKNNNNNNSINENKYLNTQMTIINESDYNEDFSPINETKMLFQAKKAKNQNQLQTNYLNNNTSNTNSIFNSNKKGIKEIKFFSSSFKKKSLTNNLSINPSYIRSLTTCHTTNKDNEELFTSVKFSRIVEFITEINLPKEYANNLIDNGFDNLDVLIYQTKHGIALTYENLRDIGIKKPGERIKILVHLEEISGNFNFVIEQKIFFDESEIKSEFNSIKIFLENIDMNKYINNFFENKIYNVELLYIQMSSRQPLNENILVNDLGINKLDANKIIIKLYENSGNYINKMDIINRTNNNENIDKKKKYIKFEENREIKSCDMCIII